MTITKLDEKINEIRSQSSETFGLRLGGGLFDSLASLGRLSESNFEGIPNDPNDINIVNVIDFKILDNEFPVLRLNDNCYSIEIAPYSDCLVHITAD